MSIKRGAARGAEKGIERVVSHPLFWILGTGVVAGAGYFLYKKGGSIIDNINQRNLDNQIDSKKDPKLSLAAEFAQRLFVAMDGAGTDEDEMYLVAQEMKNNGVSFTLVSSAFRKLTGDSLTEWLNDDLTSSEIAKFYSYLRGPLGSAEQPTINIYSLI